MIKKATVKKTLLQNYQEDFQQGKVIKKWLKRQVINWKVFFLSYNQALRIVRAEGNRVQQGAALDALYRDILERQKKI